MGGLSAGLDHRLRHVQVDRDVVGPYLLHGLLMLPDVEVGIFAEVIVVR